jgi:hypothetical protein
VKSRRIEAENPEFCPNVLEIMDRGKFVTVAFFKDQACTQKIAEVNEDQYQKRKKKLEEIAQKIGGLYKTLETDSNGYFSYWAQFSDAKGHKEIRIYHGREKLLRAAPELESEDYRLVVQGPPTNEIANFVGQEPHVLKTGKTELENSSTVLTPEKEEEIAEVKSEKIRVIIEDWDKLNIKEIRYSALLLFNECLMHLTSKNSFRNTTETSVKTKFTICLQDHMILYGLHDRENAVYQLKKDCETLLRMSLQYYKGDKRITAFHLLNLFQEIEYKNGWIQVNFSQGFAVKMMNGYMMPLSKKYFSLNHRRYPNAAPLLFTIHLHKWMNRGKPNENIFSVEQLLSVCFAIPKYEELKSHSWRERIKEPFESNLSAIEGALDWNYCNSKGEELIQHLGGKDQNGKVIHKSWHDWNASRIKITFYNYPQIQCKKEAKQELPPPNAPKKNARGNQNRYPECIREFLIDKEEVCIKEIQYDCLGFNDRHVANRRDSLYISNILEQEGWKQINELKRTPIWGPQRFWRKGMNDS